MSDRKIISQLKMLREVKPNQDWVDLTRKKILKDNKQTEAIGWAFLKSPVFVGGAVVVAAVVLIGVFGFVLDIEIPSFSQRIARAEYEKLVSSLQELRQDIVQTTSQLEDVDTVEKIFEIKDSVDDAVEDSEKFVVDAKKKVKKLKIEENGEPAGMVYSAMAEVEDVEDRVSEMKNTYQELQKEITEQQIAVLRASILTENQRDLLKEVEEYYEEGSYLEALAKIVEISQIR